MKILELQQRSPEWAELRQSCVTATDFAVIAANEGLSNNAFNKSVKSTIEGKFKTLKLSAHTQRIFDIGHKLEPVIANMLDLPDPIFGEVIIYDNHQNIMCSLDVRDKLLNLVVEIKTTRSLDEGVINKFDYYKFQLAHQCYVTGLTEGCIAIADYDDNGVKSIIKRYFEVDKIINFDIWLNLCEEFLIKLNTYREKRDERKNSV